MKLWVACSLVVKELGLHEKKYMNGVLSQHRKSPLTHYRNEADVFNKESSFCVVEKTL